MFSWQQPESFGSSESFLDVPGTYHFLVKDVKTTDRNGSPLDGFRVELEVLDGTPRNGEKCSELGKKLSLSFRNGKMNSKDGGKFAQQKQAAMFVAANLINTRHLDQIRNKTLRELDIDLMRSSQVIAAIEKRQFTNDKGQPQETLDLVFSNVWHVDDPQTMRFPKCDKSLGLIPSAMRSSAEKLQQIKDAFAGKEASNSSTSSHSSVDDM